jgi:hypothetical protein
MRDIVVPIVAKQEECLVLLRGAAGFHILTAPLDMTDQEQLSLLCAAQDIVTQRIARAQKEAADGPTPELP